MKRFIIASFSLLLLVSTADAQRFRRADPNPAGHWVLVDGRYVWVEWPVVYKPTAGVDKGVVVNAPAADAGRPGGRVRDFIKRLLGR